MNDNINILKEIKENIWESIRLQPCFIKKSKEEMIETFIKESLKLSFIKKEFIGTNVLPLFNLLSFLFDSYEVFLPYLLTQKENSLDKIDINEETNYFEIFEQLKIYDGALSTILSCEYDITNIENIIEKNGEKYITFSQNFSIINKDKFIYATMMIYKKREKSELTNKDYIQMFSNNSLIRMLFKEMESFDLSVEIEEKITLGNILDIYKSIYDISIKRFMSVIMSHVDEFKLFTIKKNDLIKLIKDNLQREGKILKEKNIKNIIEKLGYDLDKNYSIDKIKDIDFKAKPLVFNGENIYLPYHLLFISDGSRNFLSFLNIEYKNSFFNNEKKFGKIFADSPLKKLEKFFLENKYNDIILQKQMNIKIGNTDVDFSIFDKQSGTLLVFESKNFIGTHSFYDTLQKEKKEDSPISKGIQQLREKIIPFFESSNGQSFKNFFNEPINIKKIFGFVLTGNDFIGILEYPHSNIKVVSITETIKLLNKYKNSIEKIFEDIGVLADYKYYLDTVDIGYYQEQEIKIPIINNNEIKNHIFKVPIFMPPHK